MQTRTKANSVPMLTISPRMSTGSKAASTATTAPISIWLR